MKSHPTDSLEGYALGALSLEEAEAVSAHLRTCAECRTRLREIDVAVGMLADLATPLAPPPEAEGRMLARIRALRSSAAQHVSALPKRSVEPPWLRRALYTAVALAAVLALVVGILGAQLRTAQASNASLSAQSARQQQVLALLNAPDAVVRRLVPTNTTATGATGTMVMDPQTKQGVFLASRLPQLPAGKVYEFWLVEASAAEPEGQAIPQGTFRVDGEGAATFAFITALPADQLRNAGVSVESSGGAKNPDSPMIMLFAA